MDSSYIIFFRTNDYGSEESFTTVQSLPLIIILFVSSWVNDLRAERCVCFHFYIIRVSFSVLGGNNWCQKKRFKDQMTTEFILASNLIMLVFIPLGIFHYIAGQLLLKEISSKVNFMSLLD